MFNNKYSKVLTVLLVIVIIGIVGLLGFLGYDLYKKFTIDKDSQAFVDNFENKIADNEDDNTNTQDQNSYIENPYDNATVSTGTTSSSKKVTYKGFEVSGTIEIPKTNLKYPVITKVSKTAIDTAVAIQYGPTTLNSVGNTVIVGHNYRNGLFFSNNKKLENGDKIYITDLGGNRVEYIIYNKYITSESDTDYMIRDTNGAREISLSTCTDDSKQRIIIWAKES